MYTFFAIMELLLFIHIHVPHLLHLHGPKSEQQHDGMMTFEGF
jgi:hypothetical protein